MTAVPELIRPEFRGRAVQAGGGPLVGNADFDITECLPGSMEQGITEEGQQEHNNMMVGAMGHKASVCRLPS